MKKEDKTTITLSRKTKDRLAKIGKKGQSFESIIIQILAQKRKPSRPESGMGT